jgi:hypothetical protein
MSVLTAGGSVVTVETFEELLRRWRDAEARGDAAALDPLLGADFRGDGPAGYVLGKREWLDRHRSGDLVVSAFEWTVVELRVRRRSAIGSGVQTQVARYRGDDCSGEFACTVVALRGEDRWSIVNVQLSGGSRPPG